jgi:hypothetical protein
MLKRVGRIEIMLRPGLPAGTELASKKVSFSFISKPSSVTLRAAGLKASPYQNTAQQSEQAGLDFSD